jgi:hypothetical protein
VKYISRENGCINDSQRNVTLPRIFLDKDNSQRKKPCTVNLLHFRGSANFNSRNYFCGFLPSEWKIVITFVDFCRMEWKIAITFVDFCRLNGRLFRSIYVYRRFLNLQEARRVEVTVIMETEICRTRNTKQNDADINLCSGPNSNPRPTKSRVLKPYSH